MKKTLLSILTLVAFSLSTLGQTTFNTLQGDTAKASFHKAGMPVDVKNSITNITSSDITITWKVIPGSTNISNGWGFNGVCDNNLCYNGATPGFLAGTSIQVSNPYTPNVAGNFYATFDGDNATNGSSAWITVEATDMANSHTKLLTFIATKGALGVVNVKRFDEEVVLYPNPARGSVNVIFDPSLGVKNVAIYNLIGKAVSVYKVTGNSAKLDLTDVPSGIYFVRLSNSQGKIVATRKFTRQ